MSVVGELPEEEEEVKPAAARPKSVSVEAAFGHEETDVLACPLSGRSQKSRVSREKIKGTGPGGSISQEDVLKTTKFPQRTEDQTRTVRAGGDQGIEKDDSEKSCPSSEDNGVRNGKYEADITDLWDLRAREKKALEDKGVHLTFIPFFMKAIQHTLMEFRTFNASVDEDREEIFVKKYFNIGVAVDTADGLILP